MGLLNEFAYFVNGITNIITKGYLNKYFMKSFEKHKNLISS